MFFGNRWGRGAFDEGHHEQVSLDGAFGEHVIITTGGGGGTSPPIYWENERKEVLDLTNLHLTIMFSTGIFVISEVCQTFPYNFEEKIYLVWYIRWKEGKTRENTPLMCPFYISQRKRRSSHVSSDFLRMKMRSRKKNQDIKSFSKLQLCFTRSFEKVQFQQSSIHPADSPIQSANTICNH